jgi:hypothetical protein
MTPAQIGSGWSRATKGATAFIVEMLEPYGTIPAGALRDPYCIGFLQMVGVRAACKSLGSGSGWGQGEAVFEEALKLLVPRYAGEVAELLAFSSSEGSPQNKAYLTGHRDGDLYMGWKLLNSAPQHHGEAAAVSEHNQRCMTVTALTSLATSTQAQRVCGGGSPSTKFTTS